jgi:regulatory factor X
MAPQPGPGHNVFSPNPEEMIMRFGQQLAHTNNGGSLDSPMHDSQNSIMPRAEDFHNSSLQNHGLQHGSMSDMVPHGLQGMHVPHYAQMYEGAIDAHIPERLLEENDHSEAGTRKKRGSSSTVANDNELRKLLRQYEGFSLKQMAVEVQKHEGAGGKSEKVKQVFAMVWYVTLSLLRRLI